MIADIIELEIGILQMPGAVRVKCSAAMQHAMASDNQDIAGAHEKCRFGRVICQAPEKFVVSAVKIGNARSRRVDALHKLIRKSQRKSSSNSRNGTGVLHSESNMAG